MKVLSINAGSSSLKFQLYEMPEEKVLISGVFERIGIDGSFYTIKLNGEKIKNEIDLPNHKVAFETLVNELKENNIDDNHIIYINFEDYDYEEYTDPKKLNNYVKEKIIDDKSND